MRDFPLLWALLPLVLLLLLAAWIIARVRRWREEEAGELTPGDELTHYRELYEQGDLDEEEYQRIRALLGQRMKDKLNLSGEPNPPLPAGEEQEADEETPPS